MDGDKKIGFYNGEVLENGNYEVGNICIIPEYQGKGIGTELMNQMIAYMREKHIYMVSVIFEEKLKDFYEKFGFYTMLSGQLETYESR